ncbi:hypothetical protein Cch01nite_18570 [Cellulomonas chitinilytica]|uniref:Uncharacterized protein n=1 Tax=Cellulomonas chitinilytica TaxID=398759 RepID=A0A919P3C9_9CELL|nr:hypothetical protein [Cellulomonas chitinilytica]GIG21133.1 hypothetical protein Cch01nite_18570 [Cellulomonas chitinilytica]
MNDAVEELRAAVAAAAEDTPYRVLPTDEGFDLRIDVSDARWHGPLERAGQRTVVQNHVVLDPDTLTMQIIDDHLTVQWAAGASGRTPQLAAAVQVTRTLGRTWSTSREWTWGANGERVVERRFTSADAHELIRGAATELGWQETAGVYPWIGVVAAVVGGLVVLTTGLLILLEGRV